MNKISVAQFLRYSSTLLNECILVVQLWLLYATHGGPMNFLKYKVFWWTWLPMRFLKKFSRVVLMTTLGKNIYMQISAAIIENRIFFNNFFVMNSSHKNGIYTHIFMSN